MSAFRNEFFDMLDQRWFARVVVMLWMLVGLVMFLVPHSLNLFARRLRSDLNERLGEGAYQGVYSLVSLIGLALIVWGYGQTRLHAVFVWNPSLGLRHVTVLLMLLSMVFLVAAYVPGNRLRRALGHPMIVGVTIWAFAHLLSNGRLGDVVLFGAFLAWAVVYFIVNRRRDRLERVGAAAASWMSDAVVLVLGVALWAGLLVWGHRFLTGVALLPTV